MPCASDVRGRTSARGRCRVRARFRRRVASLASALVLALGVPHAARSQTPAPSVALSWGVDTTVVEVRQIVRLTRAYLAQPDSTARARGLWSTKSRFDAEHGDLAMEAYQGFAATILGVTGVGSGDSVFVVKILHASADTSRTRITPLALQRVYAVRAPGTPYEWAFSSPLPRLTSFWPVVRAGHIVFHYAPSQHPNLRKAREAAQFVDSVARRFQIAPPARLDAYVTGTTDEGLKLVGLDYFVEESGPGTGLGGRGGGAGILLLGNPAIGEAYLHELVHAVVEPAIHSKNALFSEGVAVWLGGSEGRSLRELRERLRAYQERNPGLTLYEFLGGSAPGGHESTVALYATRGLVAESIYRSQGIAGLRAFSQLMGSSAEVIRRLPEFVDGIAGAGGINGDLDRWWHEVAGSVRRP